MILKYLLDTNTISEPARPAPHPGILRRLEQHAEEIAIAAPVWHELWFGYERLPLSRKRSRIEDYLRTLATLPMLPYDSAAAEWHAAERARLETSGRTPAFIDGQIAAVAWVNDLTLVTSNKRHFDSFEDLRIEDWRE